MFRCFPFCKGGWREKDQQIINAKIYFKIFESSPLHHSELSANFWFYKLRKEETSEWIEFQRRKIFILCGSLWTIYKKTCSIAIESTGWICGRRIWKIESDELQYFSSKGSKRSFNDPEASVLIKYRIKWTVMNTFLFAEPHPRIAPNWLKSLLILTSNFSIPFFLLQSLKEEIAL